VDDLLKTAFERQAFLESLSQSVGIVGKRPHTCWTKALHTRCTVQGDGCRDTAAERDQAICPNSVR